MTYRAWSDHGANDLRAYDLRAYDLKANNLRACECDIEHMTLELRATAGVAAFYLYVSCIFFLYSE